MKTLSNFNLVVLSCLTLSNTYIDGSFLSLGNIDFKNVSIFDINSTISSIDMFKAENVTISTNTSSNAFTSLADTDIINNNLINIINNKDTDDSIIKYYSDLSEKWNSLKSIKSTSENGTLTLKGFDTTLNVFTINKDDINGAKSISIYVPPSIILINVVGVDIIFNNSPIYINDKFVTKEYAKNIAWNFYNALSIKDNYTDIYGSILAPNATLNASYVNLYGNVVVKNAIGTFTTNNAPFKSSKQLELGTPFNFEKILEVEKEIDKDSLSTSLNTILEKIVELEESVLLLSKKQIALINSTEELVEANEYIKNTTEKINDCKALINNIINENTL